MPRRCCPLARAPKHLSSSGPQDDEYGAEFLEQNPGANFGDDFGGGKDDDDDDDDGDDDFGDDDEDKGK